MKSVNGEKIYVIIIILIIIISAILLCMFFVSSNKNLNSNTLGKEGEKNTQNLQGNNKDNDINIDTSKLEKFKETEIANFSSSIYDKDENRVYNIKLAISKLDGTIVKANEEFSFNNTLGPMGETEGYKEAVGFDAKGKEIKVFGGGMCQISSTLYNAALIAGLEITERHPHSRRVYYVPKDKDATVFYNSLDLKFKNNQSNDIKIYATTDGVTVNIKLVKIEKTVSI